MPLPHREVTLQLCCTYFNNIAVQYYIIKHQILSIVFLHTSVISKFLRQSKSFKDEQADEWLKLKVDKNKIDNLLKIIRQKDTSGMYFSDKNQEIR